MSNILYSLYLTLPWQVFSVCYAQTILNKSEINIYNMHLLI